MATIKKTLSTKRDGQGYSQILFRVSIDKNKKLRLKSGIYIPENRWDVAKERMNYGKAIGGKSSVSCPLKPSDSAPLKHSTMPP